jgi:DNA-binding NarL/FixJ family response regulator
MGIRVIIVDDDRIVRESMGIILSMDKEIEVKGTFSDGDEAFNFCRQNNVDVVLMDIRMPICDGVAGTKKIKELNPNTNVIILTTFNDDNYISQALKNGASGYLLKNISPDKIMEAIKIVHSGNMLIHPEAAARLAGMLNKREEVNFSNYNLNEGETDIIKLIADGYTNKEIADRVFLSEGTVKNKISEILGKLRLRDRTQIAIFYLKGGKME